MTSQSPSLGARDSVSRAPSETDWRIEDRTDTNRCCWNGRSCPEIRNSRVLPDFSRVMLAAGTSNEHPNACSMPESPGPVFRALRAAIIEMHDSDRAYLRRWIIQYVNRWGQIPMLSASRASDNVRAAWGVATPHDHASPDPSRRS